MEKTDLKAGFSKMEEDGLVSSLVKELVEAKAYLGHNSSRTNPQMKPYIINNKGPLEVIDLNRTEEKLKTAQELMADLGNKGKSVLFVGTDPMIKGFIKEAAQKIDMPCVSGHWIGGLLTNFKIISKRINYFLKLREKEEKGELKKYTKKEQGQFRKEIDKLAQLFDGLEDYKKLPEAVVIVNIKLHDTALHEASLLSLPIIAIVDTDSDPNLVSHPIFASDHIRSSVEFILNKLAEAYQKGVDKGKSEEK